MFSSIKLATFDLHHETYILGRRPDDDRNRTLQLFCQKRDWFNTPYAEAGQDAADVFRRFALSSPYALLWPGSDWSEAWTRKVQRQPFGDVYPVEEGTVIEVSGTTVRVFVKFSARADVGVVESLPHWHEVKDSFKVREVILQAMLEFVTTETPK